MHIPNASCPQPPIPFFFVTVAIFKRGPSPISFLVCLLNMWQCTSFKGEATGDYSLPKMLLWGPSYIFSGLRNWKVEKSKICLMIVRRFHIGMYSLDRHFFSVSFEGPTQGIGLHSHLGDLNCEWNRYDSAHNMKSRDTFAMPLLFNGTPPIAANSQCKFGAI